MAVDASCISQDGISLVLSNPDAVKEVVLQVLDLKPVDSRPPRYRLDLNDGKEKIAAMLPTSLATEINEGRLQNLGLIKLLAYTCNTIGSQKVLVITNCEVVCAKLESEVRSLSFPESTVDVKTSTQKVEQTGGSYVLGGYVDGFKAMKPSIKLEHDYILPVVKSASQIVKDQSGVAAPGMRKGISRRVYPLISLNPYEVAWTIKVRVTNKGSMRTFTNARGQGNVFNVELTDEEGTQIQATMFKESADKFFDKLHLGKLYYISKGSLRAANKRFSTLNNDYEMTLHNNSEVEEIPEEDGVAIKIPLVKYNFVKIEELGRYVNGRELIDIVGVLQSVGSHTSIRRKSNNEEIPKRDIVIADDSNKTVSVSLWNTLADDQGRRLQDMMNEAPTVVIRSLRVSDYQGVSLSTTAKSTVVINPDIPEAHSIENWYKAAGKPTSLSPAGASLPGRLNQGVNSSPSERAQLCDITRPEVGDGKPAYFTVRACVSFIKPDQAMWYLACTVCNRKVNQGSGSSYWCEGCQKNFETANRRYILLAKLSDSSGEAWISAFNEQAETMLGHSAESLADIKAQELEQNQYQRTLKQASWLSRLFRVGVSQTEYMSEKRQRITVRAVAPVDWVAECKLLLEKIIILT